MAGDNDIELRVGIDSDDSSIEEYSRKLTNALNNAVKQVQSKAIYANTETLNDYVSKAKRFNTTLRSFYKTVSAESGNSVDYPKNFDTGALKTYLDTYKEVLKVQKLMIDGQNKLNSKEAFSIQESRFNEEIRRTRGYTQHSNLLTSIYGNINPYTTQEGTVERKLPYGMHITEPKLQKDFYDYIEQYGNYGFMNNSAAVSWKYHPAISHGQGGLLRHTGLVMAGIEEDAAVMGLSKEDRDSMLFSAGIHDLFKYNDRGMPNGKHAEEAADFLKSMGYNKEAEIVKTHMGNIASGYGKGSGPDKNSPYYKYQKLLADTDYLVSRTYAQDYISKDKKGKLTVDMFGLREEAVKRGEGKWVDAKAGNTPENFERVTKAVAKNTKDNDDGLKSTLVTLGAIYATYKLIEKIAKGIIKFDAKATNTTEAVASQLNSGGRWYLGINMNQELGTYQAENTAGLGKGTILGEMNKLGSNLGEMSTTGKGIDFLGTSLLGNLGVILNSNSGYDAYIKSLDFLREQYKNLPKDDTGSKKREAIGNYIEKELGKAAYDLFNYGMLHLGKDQTFASLFALPNNPYFSAYGDVEEQSAKLKRVQSEIDADWQKIYNDWNTQFGIPFKNYWNGLLQWFIESPIYKTIFGDYKTGAFGSRDRIENEKYTLSLLQKHDPSINMTNVGGIQYGELAKSNNELNYYPNGYIERDVTANGSIYTNPIVQSTGFTGNISWLDGNGKGLNKLLSDIEFVSKNLEIVDKSGYSITYTMPSRFNKNFVDANNEVLKFLNDSGYLKLMKNENMKYSKLDSESYDELTSIMSNFIELFIKEKMNPESVNGTIEDLEKDFKKAIDSIIKGTPSWNGGTSMAPININISGVDTNNAYDVGQAARRALLDSSIAVGSSLS